MKKSISISVIQFILFLFIFVPSINGLTLNEVKDSPYKYDLLWLYTFDSTETKVNLSKYDEFITRGEFVNTLYHLFADKKAESNYTFSFIDVNEENDIFKAVAWAVNEKIVSGTSITTFSPDSFITKDQALSILSKVDGYSTEIPKGESWSYLGYAWALENDIVLESGDTSEPISKGQFSSLMYQTYYLHDPEMGKATNALILLNYGYSLKVLPYPLLQGGLTYEKGTKLYKGYHAETEETNKLVCLFSDEYMKRAKNYVENIKEKRNGILDLDVNFIADDYFDMYMIRKFINIVDPFHFDYAYYGNVFNNLVVKWNEEVNIGMIKQTLDVLNKEVDMLKGKSIEEIIRYVDDMLKYNYDWLEMESTYKNRITTAVLQRTCQCGGYATYVEYLLNALGYPCIEVEGVNKEEDIGHAWNLVYVDGEWRKYDPTWQDGLEGTMFLNLDEDSFKYKVELYPAAVAFGKLYHVDKLI